MPKSEREYHWWRAAIGLIAILAGLSGILTLMFLAVPTDNLQAVQIGLGVLLGWGSQVIQSEFGSSSTGKRLADASADAVLKQVENGRKAKP